MKIQDTVYIVAQSSLYDMPIKNSVSICKAEVVAIKAKTATVKIETDTSPTTYIIQQVDSETLCTTPQQAFEQANNLIMTKDQSYESNNPQQG